MKLPQDAVIPRKKISNYLLEWRPENDKSQFLSRAGYTVGQAEQLAIDIRQQLLALDALSDRRRTHWSEWADVASCKYLDDRGGNQHNEVNYALSGQGGLTMAYQLFTKVALKDDLPEHNLRRGDVATIVETHSGAPGQEPGCSLEVFNAIGETIAVVTVRESQIEPLAPNEVLHVRRLDEVLA